VAEALLALQRRVNEVVESLVAGPPVPSGTGTGTWSFTGTASGVAPQLTPQHVATLRAFVQQARDGTVKVAVGLGALEGLLSLAERVGDLLP
jgi:hypothetical protein